MLITKSKVHMERDAYVRADAWMCFYVLYVANVCVQMFIQTVRHLLTVPKVPYK